jgi:WD40 repeat protein
MSSDSGRAADRALLAAGTEHYDYPSYGRLEDVPESLRTVAEVLTAAGFTAVAAYPGYILDPERDTLRAAVRQAANSAPAVVVYYTGHGADLPGGTFYLVGKKSGPGGLLSDSAVAARELLELVVVRDVHGDPVANQPAVLVVLDCCYAGSAGMAMVRDALNGAGNASTWVIATAGSAQYAVAGQFARALREVLAQPLSGPSQEFLSLDSLVGAVNDAIAGQAEQVAHLFVPPSGSTGVPRFFRNPGYLAGVAGRTVDEQHWLSRARAGPLDTTAGSYLTGVTGRLLAAEHLAGWINGPEPDRLAVVTGSPGTGKSALLSLPVLLSQQAGRGDLLKTGSGSLLHNAAGLIPVGLPVVAVHARGLSTDQAAGAIARALGRTSVSAAELLEDLEASPVTSREVVVIDAIDEATSPQTMLTNLAVPLARRPGLRVVVGARRHVLSSPADTGMIIDLDTGQYHDPQALAGYVSQLLTAAAEPGVSTAYQQASQDTAAAVAAGIARRAATSAGGAESFLLARLLALSLRNRPKPADLTNPDWLAGLPTSIADAFDEDLARLGHRQPLARALLAALAWARGPGLPWETIWAPVARAVTQPGDGSGGPVIDDDGIRWLLDHAGAYIVEDLGPGQRSVYRPFHDLLAAHLRGEPTTEQREGDPAAAAAWHARRAGTEAAITRALFGTVPASLEGGRDWLTAHPYLTTYLAQHAAAAGIPVLAGLTRISGYLAVADPVTLTPLLSPAHPELRETARIYRRARPLLGSNPSANAACLAEARLALTGTSTPDENTSVRPLYRTYLAAVRQDDSLLTLTERANAVSSVAFATAPDGRLLLATGSEDGSVRMWDSLTGTPLGGRLTGRARAVSSVAFATTPDGRLLLAAGSEDGSAQVWDPLTGTPLGGPLTGHANAVSSVAFGTAPDGRLLLATGSSVPVSTGSTEGSARVWDPLAGTPLGGPLTMHTSGVSSVAFGTAPDGRLLLATGSHDRTARVWDPFTGTLVGGPFTGHTRAVRSVAFGTAPDGRLLLAIGSEDGSVRVWDPLTGTPLGGRLTRHTSGVNSVTFGTAPDGRLLLATGSSDGTARVWDPFTGTLLGGPLTGHASGVRSVAFGTTPGGRLLLATGSSDGTARVWDPNRQVSLVGGPLTGHTSWVKSVAFGTAPDGRLLLATGSDAAQVWDPLTGTPLGSPLTVYNSAMSSVVFGTTLDGRLLLAAACDDGSVRVWDPLTGAPLGGPVTWHARAVAFGTAPDGRLLLATGSDDGGAGLWDPLTGAPLGGPLTGHATGVRSVAFGTALDGRLLLATGSTDCTARVWDPLTGAPFGGRLTGHVRAVNSVAFGTALDGRLLVATGSDDGSARVWDPLTGAPLGRPLTGHASGVRSVAFATASDGRLLLATGSSDGTAQVWDPDRQVSLFAIRRRSGVNAIAASALLLAIGDDESTCVIEPAL